MWTLDTRLPLLGWRNADAADSLRMGFSTRRGGVSEAPYDTLNIGRSTADRPDSVARNRELYLRQLGADPSCLVTVGQVHGTAVHVASSSGFYPERDAVVSVTPGLILAVSGADCLPILFTARGPRGWVVAAAHAGWRGTADGIALSTLRTLLEIGGVEPAAVRVHFGPCIRPCCYEVGPEVVARFPGSVVHTSAGAHHLDIPAAARLQLVEAGVPPESIEDTRACTACDSHWYFSHRRDRGVTGRQWGAIGLRPEPD